LAELQPIALNEGEFAQLVRFGPLVSIDLIVRNHNHQMLIGRRTLEPAKGWYFVPGGRIWKNEQIAAALSRIARTELGFDLTIEQARFVGVFEHIYPTSRSGQQGVGTHYVVLAYEIRAPSQHVRGDDQHSVLEWASDAEILRRPDVHQNVKAYVASGHEL
jgi:colanic acid biosynthesis protein WcaH